MVLTQVQVDEIQCRNYKERIHFNDSNKWSGFLIVNLITFTFVWINWIDVWIKQYKVYITN